ncbi:MAG: YraN family protein [Desulfobacterales bacterium]|nr:YraN family protein [Desulfobacterales bacterium]
MTQDRQQLGNTGESAAAGYLQVQGYRILQRNYRNPMGEIDLVARDHNTLVFVEVKTRRTQRFGSAKTWVTAKKQRRLSLVALVYLKQTGQMNTRARFDVVTVDATMDPPQIEVIQNAFELTAY